MKVEIKKAKRFKGEIYPPPDKSISHRAALLLSMSEGTAAVTNFLEAEDTLATLECLEKIGVQIERKNETLLITGKGKDPFLESDDVLDAKNSATTMRLISGILAAQPFLSVVTGDKYLRKRPMKRIIEPLTSMGATIFSRKGGFAPLAIYGRKLNGIYFESKLASAQVKSSILLAGIFAKGTTTVVEPVKSRDHTERMLKYLEYPVKFEDKTVSVEGGGVIRAKNIEVPGDLSSAAFFIVAASAIPEAELIVKRVGLNDTRTGVIEILEMMGASLEYKDVDTASAEPVGTVEVRGRSTLDAFDIGPEIIPSLVDEIPVLAVLATQAKGTSVIRGATELRFKESDRLKATALNLIKLGAEVREFSDGMEIKGPSKLQGALVESYGDHRIAMAMAVAGLFAEGTTIINDSECVSVSFPSFFNDLNRLV